MPLSHFCVTFTQSNEAIASLGVWLHTRFEKENEIKSPCSMEMKGCWQVNLGRYYSAEAMAERFFPPSVCILFSTLRQNN